MLKRGEGRMWGDWESFRSMNVCMYGFVSSAHPSGVELKRGNEIKLKCRGHLKWRRAAGGVFYFSFSFHFIKLCRFSISSSFVPEKKLDLISWMKVTGFEWC